MEPNTPNQQTGQVYGPSSSPQGGPTQGSVYPSPQSSRSPKSGLSNRKIQIILGGLAALFVIVFIVYLLIPGGKDSSKEPEQQQSSKPQTLVREPSAIDIEDVNNSISDDISNLNDDVDFPADSLSDENLDL